MANKDGSRRLERLAPIQRALGSAGIDVLALAVSDNLRYALGGFAPHGDERFCALLLSPSDRVFVVPALNAAQVRAHVDVSVRTYEDKDGPAAALTAALGQLKASPAPIIAVNEEMRADHLLVLQDARPEASYRPAGTVMAALRSVKDAGEIAALQTVAATADAGIEAVYAACKPGVTERDLVDAASAAMRRAGADETAFAIVGAAAHGAQPHHQADSTALQPGDVVAIDIGSRLNGYCSDITRMAVAGGAPPDAEYARVHAVVEQAWQAAQAAARPGALAREVDAAARQVIGDAGYGEYFIHRTGHGLGLSIHEPPYITSTSNLVLAKGMVFSIEPGIYLPERFGVRLEDIVFLDEDGAHVLSGLPRTVRFC